jgi:DNA-binding CsgD family transcriptional regulator
MSELLQVLLIVLFPLLAHDTSSRRLTARQRTVLDLLSQGHTNRQIAGILCLSPGTVRNQITALFAKFGARNRTDLLARVVDRQRRNHRRLLG